MVDHVKVFIPKDLHEELLNLNERRVAKVRTYVRYAIKAFLTREASKYSVDGVRLTQARISAGLSMEELGEKAGCSKVSISRWERGLMKPEERFIIPLMIALERTDFVVKEK